MESQEAPWLYILDWRVTLFPTWKSTLYICKLHVMCLSVSVNREFKVESKFQGTLPVDSFLFS